MKKISELINQTLNKSLDTAIELINTIDIDDKDNVLTQSNECPNDERKLTLIKMLKEAFCEEMLAWYQYIIIKPFLCGKERPSIQRDYEENAKDELEDHGYWLLERINQLGGDISDINSPECWNKLAPHKYITPVWPGNTKESVQQMIEAEMGAIETYKKLIDFTKDYDQVTYNKAIEILSDEEEHLTEMNEFLADICCCN